MATPKDGPFDIVTTYQRLLSEDPELTMPVAAIEALILALATTPASTVSETLDLVSKLTATLKRRIPNSISLSAGTDLFQQYLITNLQRPSGASLPRAAGSSTPSGGDFEHVRAHLIQNGKLFVARAKAARTTIASFGRHFIRDGTTVLTNGGSRVVGALLQSAADSSSTSSADAAAAASSTSSHAHGEDNSGDSNREGREGAAAAAAGNKQGSVRFRVIYVVSSDDADSGESAANIAALRRRDVPVAVIPPTAVAHCLDRVTQVFVGAEGVVENGGIISRMGTFQLGMLAKAAAKPLYVVAESHKFVRLYPLGQRDLGLRQRVLDFRTAKGSVADDEEDDAEGGLNTASAAAVKDEGVADMDVDSVGQLTTSAGVIGPVDDLVDYTPPNLISGIITESGVLLPSAVSEELIKIWF